jgi:hypothetical protein
MGLPRRPSTLRERFFRQSSIDALAIEAEKRIRFGISLQHELFSLRIAGGAQKVLQLTGFF